ncbi:MAG: hypothetical protein HC880_20000 [Bacteroidia bacterium]|nr:hypothetical protein [Bacteroidia bacterium]
MQNSQNTYKPVADAFYDLLEAQAEANRYCKIQYFTEIREFITLNAVIKKYLPKTRKNLWPWPTARSFAWTGWYRWITNFHPIIPVMMITVAYVRGKIRF